MGYYAGIGSRETPPDVLKEMEDIAAYLADAGWVLRSGGAEGADSAFESGANKPFQAVFGTPLQLFLPWPDFNGKFSPYSEPPPLAFQIAEQYHPAWARCTPSARKLHARNSQIILGPMMPNTDFDPSEFVLCWTPRGEGSGGTGQGIRVARGYNIPVFDMAIEGWADRCAEFLTRKK